MTEAVVFCGIQGSGKTTFYVERFLTTHIRLSLDMLRTRGRETLLMRACIAALQSFVVDNTNPTAAERRRYVEAATAARFTTVAYFFDVRPRDAIARNERRGGKARIPVKGILGTHKRLEPPRREEGFDAVFRVRIGDDGEWIVEPA
jgi:predicted kinase